MPTSLLPVVEKLKPYLIEEKAQKQNIGTEYETIIYDAPIYVWKCCPEAGTILKTYTDHLLGWMGGELPEDLSFQNADGKIWLRTVTHERYAELLVTAAEAENLKEPLRGTMLVEPKSDLSPEKLFELAKFHQSDIFEYTGSGSAAILPRLHEIESLRKIDLFDAGVEQLPESLFELPHLQSLTIWTSNLHPLPSSIGQARHLQHLKICNGSHPAPNQDPEWKVPAKEELKLVSLPEEMGQLTQLQELDLTYTGLTDLPTSFKHLQKLKWLSLTNHKMDQQPAVLAELNPHTQVTFQRDGLF
ncbi:leucine-rich repeat domain-containing protein [Saccharibacillus sp. JS10]|uniref:leucine-rich repeat domain-containing protein n=1 Tax=Saccharibacillus sp. JS10 TaxID=2950552 RepID=UPI00210D60D9|nr:hypothetical protein [Saccharibacillus sp. JS10]MCQ4088478.1 hypothetical protein [Saccharibacillus sp. JS10]